MILNSFRYSEEPRLQGGASSNEKAILLGDETSKLPLQFIPVHSTSHSGFFA